MEPVHALLPALDPRILSAAECLDTCANRGKTGFTSSVLTASRRLRRRRGATVRPGGTPRDLARASARAGASALALAFFLLLAPRAHAHVIFDRTTLRQQTEGAAVVAVVEMESNLVTWSAPDGSDHQEHLRARRISVLKGEPLPEHFDFFPHAEGEPGWRARDRAVVFLDRTTQRAEFLSLAARFPYFTVQGAGQEWVLAKETEAEVTEAVRAFIDLAAHPAAPDAAARLRGLLLRGLRARDARLRSDALAELVRARARPDFFHTAQDVAPFAKLCEPGRLAAGERIGLALLLDGAPGFDTNARLRAMTREKIAPRDRLVLVRASAVRGDPALVAWIESLRADPDPSLRAEAEAALARARVTVSPSP